MNCFNYFDQSLLIQQQLILQQLFIYNQMIKASQNQTIQTQKISIQKLKELETSNSQLPKHDDTNPIQSQEEQNINSKLLKIKQKKVIKKPKKQNNNNAQKNELSKKKKVFLSMMDIKEVHYKQFKAQSKQDNQKVDALLVDPQI